MPDLERILQLTPGTLSQQWMQDGVAVDPGTVTIGITRADGTVLVAAGTAVAGSGSAPRTFNLTTTHTSLLDRLKITWTSSLKGTVISYLEVVGGRLFTMAEALSRPQLASVTPVNLELARLRAEQYLERRCGGRSFFPRYSFDQWRALRRHSARCPDLAGSSDHRLQLGHQPDALDARDHWLRVRRRLPGGGSPRRWPGPRGGLPDGRFGGGRYRPKGYAHYDLRRHDCLRP
jgi:hypothetical protein